MAAVATGFAAAGTVADARPLVLHLVYRFDTGGLENGIVNLINHMPADRYRHAVVALTEVTPFRQRIVRNDVTFVSLHKAPGQGFRLFPRLYALFRELRPAIVHSRNLAALEGLLPAWAAGVPVRIHGEHGREVGDLDGSNRRYQWVRRFYRPFVTRYVALSRDLAAYLADDVQVPRGHITQIYNGVDTSRFSPRADGMPPPSGCPFAAPAHWVVGTVGRMQPVKDPLTLARAFVRALELAPALRLRLRLAMVGAGPLRDPAQALLADAGVADLAWLPGERSDVDAVMRGLDCFVLPSLAEGISNTILEAMASGLAVIATGVGGNADLVTDGATGHIVPAADVDAMARRIVALADAPDAARRFGTAGRQRAENDFSMPAMVAAYQALYDRCLAARPQPRKP